MLAASSKFLDLQVAWRSHVSWCGQEAGLSERRVDSVSQQPPSSVVPLYLVWLPQAPWAVHALLPTSGLLKGFSFWSHCKSPLRGFLCILSMSACLWRQRWLVAVQKD